MKVLVAMSGGVDSSVAAAQMVEAGHEVIGVTLKLWEGPNGEAPTAGCCTVSDAEDARRVAAQLDIPVLRSQLHIGLSRRASSTGSSTTISTGGPPTRALSAIGRSSSISSCHKRRSSDVSGW